MGKKKILIIYSGNYYYRSNNNNLAKSANLLKEMILQSTDRGKSAPAITNGEFECDCIYVSDYDKSKFKKYIAENEIYKIIHIDGPDIDYGKYSNLTTLLDFAQNIGSEQVIKSPSENTIYGWSGNYAYIKSIKTLSKEIYDEIDDDINKLSKLFQLHYNDVIQCLKENNLSTDENLIINKDRKLKNEKSKHILRRSVMGGLALAAPPIALTFLFAEGFNTIVTDNITKMVKKKSNRNKMMNGIFELRVLYFYLNGLQEFLYESEKTVNNDEYFSADSYREYNEYRSKEWEKTYKEFTHKNSIESK